MNELNYGSQPASQKLADNGIVLETDFRWATHGTEWELIPSDSNLDGWITSYPAPSMAEVCRLLPLDLMICGRTHPDVDSLINELIKYREVGQ